MDRLWAPWRLSYVETGNKKTVADFLAEVDRATDDRANLVIERTELSIVVLNRFPYSNGHLLVAPRRAVPDLEGMTESELLDSQLVIRRMIAAMNRFLNADGYNVGLNLGRAAGAGLPQHLHWHVVPRWNGDTNFMTVVNDMRVIVQSLDECWLQLRRALGHQA